MQAPQAAAGLRGGIAHDGAILVAGDAGAESLLARGLSRDAATLQRGQQCPGIADGLDRKQATMLAYKGCARAMYQSWGVIGIGLSVFSLSPFGPTQRFGHMMLAMLTIAFVGNLVFLPALLAGPLGGVFAWSVRREERRKAARHGEPRVTIDPGTDELPAPHVIPGPAKQAAHA